MECKYVKDTEAAKRLGLAVQTLRNWRNQRRGPKYTRLGRAIRYEPAELDLFAEAGKIDPAADAAL